MKEQTNGATNKFKEAIKVNDIWKSYRFYATSKDILLQKISDTLKTNNKYYEEYEALKNITFSVYPGETVGIVGKNGSGKSTLLEIIAGTLTPDRGNVAINGRIGALLELGSGFNPEYTGIENIMFSAQIMGIKKDEIQKKLQNIIDFADIGDFITKPIKTYSSGMVVRLAFSVQSHTDPRILIVDEALAVGDELFQKKCFNHLKKLKENGVAILLVTHSCQQINKHCDRAILINKGKIELEGKPSLVTTIYQQLINKNDSEWSKIINNTMQGQKMNKDSSSIYKRNKRNEKKIDPSLLTKSKISYEPNGAKIVEINIKRIDEVGYTNEIEPGEDFIIQITYESSLEIEGVFFGCHISNKDGQRLAGQRMPPEIEEKPFLINKNAIWKIEYYFKGALWPGIYFVGAGIYVNENEEKEFIHRVIDAMAFRVTDNNILQPMGLCSLAIKKPIQIIMDEIRS